MTSKERIANTLEKNQIDLEFIYLKRVHTLSAVRGAYLPAITGEREREKK